MLNALGNIAAGREEEASASGGMQRLDSNCTIKTTIVDDLPAAEEKKAIASSSSSSNSSSSSPSSSSSSSISTSSSSSVSNSSSIEQISEKSSSAASSSADKSRNYSSLLKYVSLFVLVLQNAALVLVTRYATTRQQTPFLKSVAVFYNEVIKIVVATLLFFFTTGGSPKKAIRELREKFSLMDTLKLGVPALAYTVQTFLLYVSIENLDAATFMVTYQLKILTTAFFTVLILKRRLSLWQWLALLILVAGVATVQISADQQNSRRTAKSVASNGSALSLLANASSSSSNSSANILSMASNNSSNSSQPPTAHGPGHQQNLLKGFLSVVTVCFLSGFAGVYIEKILKRSKELSIWMQNMQLAMMAIPISLCVVAIQDGRKALEGGFMQGFDLPVWGIVCLQSLGGIATAVVIKYADNILKAFAVAFGIILVTIAAIFLFGIFPKPLFIAGATLVIAAVAIYSMLPYRSSKVAVAESESENDEGTAAAGKSVKFEEGKEKC